MDLAGIDEYHPLMQLKKFSEWYYSETFPVAEFAAWLNRPAEAVTGLCIDLANRGFLFYDRTYNEVTLKKKVNDFLTAFAKKRITIFFVSTARQRRRLIMRYWIPKIIR